MEISQVIIVMTVLLLAYVFQTFLKIKQSIFVRWPVLLYC
ncbi:hypothetical protein [Maribacter litopenaei]